MEPRFGQARGGREGRPLTNSAAPGRWGPTSIRACAAIHGLPPQMASVSPTRFKEMTSKKSAEVSPPSPVQTQYDVPQRQRWWATHATKPA